MKSIHNGYDYEVKFCDPSIDWGEHKGMFHVDVSVPLRAYYFDTYKEAELEACKAIDKFIESVPKTKQEWLAAVSSCMVWSGYEHCELDETMVWDLLQKAAKFLGEQLYREYVEGEQESAKSEQMYGEEVEDLG